MNAVYSVYDYFIPRNPVTQNREIHIIPTSVEKWIGKMLYSSHIRSSGGELFETDSKYGKYVKMVKEIGQTLAKESPRPGLDFEFKVVKDTDDNAWCLPGGKIAINIGLIKSLERETDLYSMRPFTIQEKVPAVLSHEITHATARHSGRAMEFKLLFAALIKVVQYAFGYFITISLNQKIKTAVNNLDNQLAQKLTRERDEILETTGALLGHLSSFIAAGVGQCNSRSHELEADKYGMHLFLAAVKKRNTLNFTTNSVASAIWLQKFFHAHHDHKTGISWYDYITSFFSSHPTPEERIEANKQTWQELQTH